MIIKYGIDKIVKEAALVVEGRAWGGVFLPRVVAFPFPNETPTGRGPTNREGKGGPRDWYGRYIPPPPPTKPLFQEPPFTHTRFCAKKQQRDRSTIKKEIQVQSRRLNAVGYILPCCVLKVLQDKW